MNHLTPDDASRWALGLLEDEQLAIVETHAEQCRDCEALLQREARAQRALADTLRAVGTVVPLRRPVWRMVTVAAALAALLALVVARGPAGNDTSSPDGGLTGPDESHFAGERLPPEALVANAPFAL